MRYPLIAFVKLWRALISPLYGDVCKYYPSCSEYGLKSLQTHGALKGSWLTITRIARCHPWAAGGYDPVPGTPEALAYLAETDACRVAPSGTNAPTDLPDLSSSAAKPLHEVNN